MYLAVNYKLLLKINIYIPDKPFSEPTGVSSEMMSGEADLITMLAKYRRGEFLQEDMEMKFIIWQNKYFATSDNSFKTKQVVYLYSTIFMKLIISDIPINPI